MNWPTALLGRLGPPWPRPSGNRLVALGSVGVALGVSTHVLYRFVDVTGATGDFLVLVGVMLALATASAWLFRPRWAALLGFSLFGGGLIWYQTTLGGSAPIEAYVTDALWVLSGNSLLTITNVTEWAFAIAPGHLFLGWYLALRARYDRAMIVVGVVTLVFVLTGDLIFFQAVLVVAFGTLAVVAGDFAAVGREFSSAQSVSIALSLMLVGSVLAAAVPIGIGTSVAIGQEYDFTAEPGEGTAGGADPHYPIRGSIELGPERLFTVVANESTYWRETSYGRYTGDGWVRTAGSQPYAGADLPNDSTTRILEQRVLVNRSIDGVPGAWRPVQLTGLQDARRGEDGSFVVRDALESGTNYTVTSVVPVYNTSTLNATGTADTRAVYTQLPESTAPRVANATAQITSGATTPYQTAVAVERWLEANKNYTLEVERPDGRIAENFLYEMDAGYCTYFATTMVVMLRTEGIPARFVTGYTPGVQVGEDRWAVLDQHSHAWIEVYLPDAGWVRFDPTPGGPRTAAEQAALPEEYQPDPENETENESEASAIRPGAGLEAVLGGAHEEPGEPVNRTRVVRNGSSTPDTENESNDTLWNRSTLPTQPTTAGLAAENQSTAVSPTVNQSANATVPGPLDQSEGQAGPSRIRVLSIVGLGLVLGGYLFLQARPRLALVWRLLRVALFQGHRDSRTQIETAFALLETYLAHHERPRERGETVRQWFRDLDVPAEAMTALTIRERARYGDRASPDAGAETTSLVAAVIGSRLLTVRQ